LPASPRPAKPPEPFAVETHPTLPGQHSPDRRRVYQQKVKELLWFGKIVVIIAVRTGQAGRRERSAIEAEKSRLKPDFSSS
jgi:hypothetical protein